MIITGIDIIEIQRINDAVERWGNRFLERIYTDNEISYCRGRMPSLAARFAAKEGTMKALGTGIRGVRWRDVEVVRERSKAPTIRLHGGAARIAKDLGVQDLALSLSHSRHYAIASVVGWSIESS